jgi:AmmeMemoRadiSam system protein B/AmmeMemoRadiSam system protein A
MSGIVGRGIRVISAIAALLVLCEPSCGSDSREGGNAEMGRVKVRRPAVAGSFYPGSEATLREDVRSMLDKAAPSKIDGKVIGLICPHAGYVYSGQIAADAYSTIGGKQFDAVIVVAPSHRVAFRGSSIYSEGRYATPLGQVELEADLAEAIAKADPSFSSRADAHDEEHSLEVQVPFLQMAVRDLKLVPIVMGDQSFDAAKRLAAAIADASRAKNVLLVASTDLSHFHDYDEAVRLDRVVIDRIKAYDPEGLADDLGAEKCEACGGGPVVAVMLAARELGATKSVILRYANSGDVTGDRSRVVGYLAAALVAESRVGVDLGLSAADKAELLKIARKSIEARVRGKAMPTFAPSSPILGEKRGAFVTLTEGGELRGCIGHIVGTQPLYRTVSEMAVAAATEDPRFPPLASEELDNVAIEVSVLTPLRKVAGPDEIEVGRDGIYLEKGHNRGLLLPQVATEYGWDCREFLDHTCLKAGLPKGSWREGANIQAFSAQVFNEAEILGSSSATE